MKENYFCFWVTISRRRNHAGHDARHRWRHLSLSSECGASHVSC